MVMLITRINAIARREGFLIDVYRKLKGGKKRPFLNSSNGHLGPYNFHRKLKDAKTVNDWKKERFEPSYPGYGCDILLGNGKKAAGQTSLRTVRNSYAAPPP
jgi:hypothetical protein